MKKVILVSFLFVGCGAAQRACTNITGELTQKCAPNGIEYLQSDSGLALYVDQDGNPVKCK